MKIGAQLYTVRDFTKTVPEIKETLAKIADIGYKSIQISALGPIEPKELRAIADENDLEVAITHSDRNRILNDTSALIEEHNILGCKHIGIGYFKFQTDSSESYDDFIKELEPAAKLIRKSGLKLHYHNHAFEFEKVGNITGFEYFVKNTDPDLWGFILDTYWVQYGGCNPTDMIYSMKDRINAIHLKDFAIKDDTQRMAEIMEGNLDWKKILTACDDTGIEFGLVEQDTDWKVGPFESLQKSFDNLKKYYEGRS